MGQSHLRIAATLVAIFCWLSGVRAQNSENDRARNFIQRFQLGALATLDSSFLSGADKAKLAALNADHSPAALCAHGSDIDCSTPFSQAGGLKLTGERLDKEHVKLDWQTTTEVNSSYFVLERRSVTDTLRYDSIAARAGQGNSGVKSNYNAIDNNNLPVAVYYRVKEVFLDGSFVYSNEVLIWGVAPKLTILAVPNPGSAASVGFYISGTASPNATWLLLNTAGAVIVKQPVSGLTGSTYISLAQFHLQRGVYIIHVITDHEQASQRVIVL